MANDGSHPGSLIPSRRYLVIVIIIISGSTSSKMKKILCSDWPFNWVVSLGMHRALLHVLIFPFFCQLPVLLIQHGCMLASHQLCQFHLCLLQCIFLTIAVLISDSVKCKMLQSFYFFFPELPFSLVSRCLRDVKHGVQAPKMKRQSQTGIGRKLVRYGKREDLNLGQQE